VGRRGKLALADYTLRLTSATFDEVLRLTVAHRRQEAGYFMDAANVVLSDRINRPLARPRIDADPNAHKIANLELMLGHAEPTNIVNLSSSLSKGCISA
jgi:hypothetical protein